MRILRELALATLLLANVAFGQDRPAFVEFVSFHRPDVEGYRLIRRGTVMAEVNAGGTAVLDIGADTWEFYLEAFVGTEKSAQYVVHVTVPEDSSVTLDCTRAVTDQKPPFCQFVIGSK